MDASTTSVIFDDAKAVQELIGPHDAHLKVLSELLALRYTLRGNELTLTGRDDDVMVGRAALIQLYELVGTGHRLFPSDIRRGVQIVAAGHRLEDVFRDELIVTVTNRRITPKNLGQKRYVDAIRSHDLTFGIGPAGTGKTYLAMAMAVSALLNNRVRRIILTRPAVEAGERLGFLPGDMAEKVNPYLRPLHDALFEMVEQRKAQQMINDKVVEVAPLAFMRGRTLNDAFVILDEAQNATRQQMKMFLTRIGFNTVTVVTGDITQIDLEDRTRSGLVHAHHLLGAVAGVAMCQFERDDVVRHPLVRKIIEAYEADESGVSSRR